MNPSYYIFFDKLHKVIANIIAWFCTILVVLICLDVLLRYLFSISFNSVTELEWYIFSIIFLLGLSYTYRNDRHVRVDVIYNKMSPEKKNFINKTGIILFLIPFCLIVIYYSSKFTYNSWIIGEGSPEAGGLPFRFLVKALIPFGYFMLLIQAFLLLFNSKTQSS